MVRAPVRSISRPTRGAADRAHGEHHGDAAEDDLARQAERVLHVAAQHRGHQEGGAPADDLREAEADGGPGRGRDAHAARDLFGIERQQARFAGGADAALGDQRRDQPRRRDVEGGIGGRAALGQHVDRRRSRPSSVRPGDARDLVGVALLDRDVAWPSSIVQSMRGIGQRRHRTARRCRAPPAPSGRCRSCCRRRRARVVRSVPTMQKSTWPRCIRWPPALSAITVCGTPCLRELPGRQAGALVARPRLVDPDMDRDAGIVRLVDRRQRGAPVDGGEPAGVAMGERVDAARRRGLQRAGSARGRARRCAGRSRHPRRRSRRRAR